MTAPESERPKERRVALVTGASRGIGRAIASALSRDGLFVLINYQNGEAAARLGLRPGDQLDSIGGQRFATVSALHDWLKGRPAAERVPLLVRRFSNADLRVTAEYHRFEIQPTDLRLLKADE